jgi:hypothetical protein
MGEKITFGDTDFGNLELVRQVVLRRLKEDPNFNDMHREIGFEQFVVFPDPRHRLRFSVLAREVMWDLLFQRVISPGLDRSNPHIPLFHLTDYGKQVLECDRFVPHDPVGYIQEIRAASEVGVSDVTVAYLEEALQCFTRGCHTAAVLLLGVAAETVFLSLCQVIEESLKDPGERTEWGRLQTVKQKHRWVVSRYEHLPETVKRGQLPESLDLTLIALYDLIRRQRDDLGHPPETLPHLAREQAFVFFRLFPGFISAVEAFAAFCRRTGI